MGLRVTKELCNNVGDVLNEEAKKRGKSWVQILVESTSRPSEQESVGALLKMVLANSDTVKKAVEHMIPKYMEQHPGMPAVKALESLHTQLVIRLCVHAFGLAADKAEFGECFNLRVDECGED